jgi:hypothetical protein
MAERKNSSTGGRHAVDSGINGIDTAASPQAGRE